MVQKDIKNLTITEIKKQVKKLNETQSFTVFIGEVEYKMTCDSVFRKTKQHKVLDDMVEYFNEGSNRIELLELATPYTALLILKHFTSLDVSDDIDEALTLLEVLIDFNVLEVMLEALPAKEVVKVFELIGTTVDVFRANLEEAEKEAEALNEAEKAKYLELDELKEEEKLDEELEKLQEDFEEEEKEIEMTDEDGKTDSDSE